MRYSIPGLLACLLVAGVSLSIGQDFKFTPSPHRDQALAKLKEASAAVDRDPSDAHAHLQRGRALVGLGSLDEAIGEFSFVLTTDPANAQARSDRAYAYLAKGELLEAGDDLDRLIADGSKDIHIHECRVFIWFLRLNAREGKLAANRAIELDPKRAGSYQLRGVFHLLDGEYEDSIRDSTTAIELGSGKHLAHSYRNRSSANAHLGKYDECIRDLRSAIDADPEMTDLYLELALFLSTCPDEDLRVPSEALEHARTALRLSGGKNPQAHARTAMAHAALGDYSSAEADARRGLAACAPNDREPFRQMIECYRKSEHYRPPNYDKATARTATKASGTRLQ